MANVRELKANNTVYDIIGKGVADQHNMSGNPLKLWTGTYAEYTALQTVDADTLYILTDEQIPAKVQTIFDFKWADHIIDDPSWIQSDIFNWYDGNKYTSAYDHLLADISNGTISTDTIAGYTVTYYRAGDDHKVALADQESAIQNIYNATGIAWYYVLDTTNVRFKLPRTNFGFVGARNDSGDYVPESLPSIMVKTCGTNDGTMWHRNYDTSMTGIARADGVSLDDASGSSVQISSISSTTSNPTYQDNAPVQQRATEMFLYFYVGDTITNSEYIDISALNSEVENKANTDLDNADSNIDFVIETKAPTSADPSWYRLYRSGWIEQGGRVYTTSNAEYTITFIKEMADTNYFFTRTSASTSPNGTGATNCTGSYNPNSRGTTSIKVYGEQYSAWSEWEVKGFAAT